MTFQVNEDSMVFRIFIFFFCFCFCFVLFCLEPTVRKDIWIRTTSVTVTVIFPKYHADCSYGTYLITAMFKVRSQQLQATLTAAFWKTSDSWRFYRHGSTYVCKIITCTKSRACTKNISKISKMTFHLFLYAFFSV